MSYDQDADEELWGLEHDSPVDLLFSWFLDSKTRFLVLPFIIAIPSFAMNWLNQFKLQSLHL